MLLISPRPEKQLKPLSSADKPRIKTALTRAANFCANAPCPILVTGGLALALHAGGIYRHHHDLDLAVFESDLPEFLDYIDHKGYRILRSIASGHVSPWHDVYMLRETSAKDLVATGLRHLRIIPKTYRNLCHKDPLTDFFDLFVYRKELNHVYLFQEGRLIPDHDFFPITRCDLGGGQAVYIPNIRFMRGIKVGKDTPANRLDLQVMDSPWTLPFHFPFADILSIAEFTATPISVDRFMGHAPTPGNPSTFQRPNISGPI